MKEDTARGIQVAANVAVIIAAVLLSVVLAKNYLIRKPEPSVAFVAGANNISTRANRPAADSQIQPGTKISLEGIDWAKNGKTLVLALSDKCHFCSESAPFYQRLSKDHGNTRLVAVLPQPIEDGKTYLNHLNV